MNKNILSKMLVPVCAMTALIGCVKQEDVQQLQTRLTQQEIQQQQLRSQLANSQPMQADTWSTVQSMQQELNTLRGQLDDLKFQLENYPSTDEMNAMRGQVARNEAALRRVDSQFAMELDLDAPKPEFVPMTTPSFGGTPAASGDGSVDAATVTPATTGAPSFNGQTALTAPTAPTAPTPAAQAPTTSQNVAAASTASSASSATGTFVVGGASTQTPAPTEQAEQAKPTEQALYDAGLAAFHARNYESALKSFSDFAKVYPKHELTPNAWFWQGECSYQMAKYPEAALAYEQVISKFPKSGKAPSAMMKQGLCFLKMGKKDAAFIRLKDVSKKYPNSPESQRAQQIIKENQ